MIVSSRLSPVAIPNTDIYSSLQATFSQVPQKTAIIDVQTGTMISYQNLQEAAERLAARFYNDYGVRPADRIAIYSENSSKFVVVVLAAFRIGATIVTVNFQSTTNELVHYLKTSDPRLLISDASHANRALDAAKICNVKYVLINGVYNGSDAMKSLIYPTDVTTAHSPLPELSTFSINPKKDVAIINFSSGTSGLPKAVMISHYNVLAFFEQLRHPAYAFSSKYRLIYQPLAHIFGFSLSLLSLKFELTILLIKTFSVETYLKTIETYKIDTLHMVPPVAARIVKSPLVNQFDLSHLKNVITASAPLASAIEQKLRELVPNRKLHVIQAYGLTETTGFITHSPNELIEAQGGGAIRPVPAQSIGLLLPNTEAMIVDVDSKQPVGPNKLGEIWARGPQMMLGYYRNDDATRDTIDEHGWVKTGDIGYYNTDGYFFITGRIKELIKYNTYQVPPAELEALIHQHPSVEDVGVFGLPDSEAGELPRAWVVVKPGHHLTEKSIVDWVASRAAPYKWLRGGVKLVEAIPRNPSGKTLRRLMNDTSPPRAKL